MGLKENQKSKWVQSTTKRVRKITGLWEMTCYDKKGRAYDILKSGRINVQGWINLSAYGENSILFVVPNRKRRKHQADYYLCVGPHYPVSAPNGTPKG